MQNIQNQATLTRPQVKSGLSQGMTLFTFLMGIFLGALDHSVIGPALSSILASYEMVPAWGSWSFSVYTLVFAVSIPVLGKLSDRFGRKQTFMFGITSFAVGSLICALAPNFTVFLLGRAVQAIGAGGIFPITASHIAVTYPPEQRGKTMGMIGVAFGLGSILGPTIGGMIIAYADWQWVFLINIPLCAIILLMMSQFKSEQQTMKKPIDYVGIMLLALMIVSIMLGITLGSSLFFLVGVVIAPVLFFYERKQADPVMNMNYVTKLPILILLIGSLLSGLVMTVINIIPLFAESHLGFAKGNAGLSIAPLAIASMAASLYGGMLVDKIGAKKVLLAGFALTALATVGLATGIENLALYYAVTIVLGFGIGIVIGAPLNILLLQVIDIREAGAAVGYLSLFRSLGSTISPAVTGKLITLFAASGLSFTYAFSFTLTVSVVSLVLLLVFVKAKAVAKS
ncbi:MFS transporter [Brevibacillus dissolubilis]|uniref:MFS transporter n=1 Tax=Brevibacillus dissolubilis TaxID=1844116 RepID=UPI001116628A|nr:MFS transporter [Brevibacillus dissolubilis]